MAKKTNPENTAQTVSKEPYLRALERIEALEARGQDAHEGTLRRLMATSKPDKIRGIFQAAITKSWTDIAELASGMLH